MSVDNLMHEKRAFPPPEAFTKKALLNSIETYRQMYRKSIEESDKFWLEQANSLEWIKHPSTALKWRWNTKERDIFHTWFQDGLINVSQNCLDRHLDTIGDKTALIWQGDEDKETRKITYKKLHHDVCQFANVLKSHGIQKGDRIALYMPMVPELVVAMLACARIGAIHSVVFGGFSAESLAHRINDCDASVLITANASMRGGKTIPLKSIADAALKETPRVRKVIVYKRNETPCFMDPHRDCWWHEEMKTVINDCPPVSMNAEDPLFILYTSGSTGQPKGAVHTQAGYLLWAALTHKYLFDLKPDDIYWCTADIGWVTGHSYIVYGPLANGATCLMFEGIPTYPDAGRFWQIVEKWKVTLFYTAPTAIRALMGKGDEIPSKYNLESLRLLGTVGEPINPEAWIWYHEKIGKGRCPVIDTWWQTETGGILIAPMPGIATLKPGSAWKPFFGVEPVIYNDDHKPSPKNSGGSLCIKKPWPGMFRTLWGDHDRFIDTYFTAFPNVYFTGDGARIDDDGDYWLMGRIDDVILVSGHRIGSAEVESALVSHEKVAEAAVVPMPHSIKGQCICAFVTLNSGVAGLEALKQELIAHVKKEIGPIALPDKLVFAPQLPKTRSGKIMRRILRKIAAGDTKSLGDTTTLADPSAVDEIIRLVGL